MALRKKVKKIVVPDEVDQVIMPEEETKEANTYHDVRLRRSDIHNWTIETKNSVRDRWCSRGYYGNEGLEQAAKRALSMAVVGDTTNIERLEAAFEKAADRIIVAMGDGGAGSEE